MVDQYMHDMANVVSLVHGSTEGHCDDVHWTKLQIIQKNVNSVV